MQQHSLKTPEDYLPLQQNSCKGSPIFSNCDDSIVTNFSARLLALSGSPTRVSVLKGFPRSEYFDDTKKDSIHSGRTPQHGSLTRGLSRKRFTQAVAETMKRRQNSQQNRSKNGKEDKAKTSKKLRAPNGLNSEKYQHLVTLLTTMLNKQDKTKKLNNVVRRKSCTCTWCGGESHKGKKFDHIFAKKLEEKPEKEPENKEAAPARRKKKQKRIQTSIDSHNSLDFDVLEKSKTVPPTIPVRAAKRFSSKTITPMPSKIVIVTEEHANVVNNLNNLNLNEAETIMEKMEKVEVTPDNKQEEAELARIPKIEKTRAAKSHGKSPGSSPITSKTTPVKRIVEANMPKNKYKITTFSALKIRPKESASQSSHVSPRDQVSTTPLGVTLSKVETPRTWTKRSPNMESPYTEYSNAIKTNKVMPKYTPFIKTFSAKLLHQSPLPSPPHSTKKINIPNDILNMERIIPQSARSTKLTPRGREKGIDVKAVPGQNGFTVYKNIAPLNFSKVGKKDGLQSDSSLDKSGSACDQEIQAFDKKSANRRTVRSNERRYIEALVTPRRNAEGRVQLKDGFQITKQIYESYDIKVKKVNRKVI